MQTRSCKSGTASRGKLEGGLSTIECIVDSSKDESDNSSRSVIAVNLGFSDETFNTKNSRKTGTHQTHEIHTTPIGFVKGEVESHFSH